ncbi:hypothetical protein KFK09_013109 [Dendrobium nobile]|uniref:RIN4 pathogenic type III effector avirulence factor Avr cleavage site domain-containing protein n=1 Tax=Dendrobium nobile TaxID=94219 RepID=A0A8T3B7V7_DENNO|nr:hypothetical protein KFK09_013109 [Dendrobium nobile]
MDKSIDVSKDNWMSVPAFGDWEKLQGMPDYSMDFSKIRESRKQSKSNYSRISTGNEADLLSHAITASASDTAAPPVSPEKQAWLGRKAFMSYFACCGTKSSS